MNDMGMSKWKMISYFSALMVLCVCAFLFAKYMVRRGINSNQIPIDTSTRIQ